MNAIRLPSGDQTGKMSRPPEVTLRRPVPFRFMVKMPEPRRANASRFPSGENAGWTADLLPFVICCTPAPFVWMRIN